MARQPSTPSSAGTHGYAAKKSRWPLTLLLTLALPVALAAVVYQLDSFDPAPYPAGELTRRKSVTVPKRNAHALSGSEKVGEGKLWAPEDIAYDRKAGVIYTGCNDGWLKRVTVNESAGDSVVEDWVNTGGRPLGVACGHNGEVIVADVDKGLLKVSSDGKIELLADEAEGVKFKLTDGVDVAENGIIYFTDASYKYSFWEFIYDFLEGRPYGRLLSYNPKTKQTQVLARDLYFANGVAVSPDQQSIIFCETPLSSCKRFYIDGEKKGSMGRFVDIPGMPDNIRYDGEGQYWIALATEVTYSWELAQKYPFMRKMMAIMDKYVGRPHLEKNGGAFSVDLEGNPTSIYHDKDLSLISGALKIGDYLYLGSINKPYMLRLNIKQNPAISN